MAYPIQEKLESLTTLCRRYSVRRLVLFGSALRADFDPQRSDLDFLVDFKPFAAGEYAKAYFGLQCDLEKLFGRSIDLVEAGAIRNPYLQRSVDTGQEILYAA